MFETTKFFNSYFKKKWGVGMVADKSPLYNLIEHQR